MNAPPTGGTIRRLRNLVARDQLDAALRGLIEFFGDLAADPVLDGRAFPFPEFDAICEQIGRASAYDLLSTHRAAVSVEHDIVLVTETTVQGGHAELVRDIAEWSEREVVIVATNLYDREVATLPGLAGHPRVIDIVELDERTMLDRLRSVQALIANPAARRVLVLCHAPDAVAIAAAAAVDAKPVLFFHHCDHTPCPGAFMPRAVHVDLHNLGFEHCRMELGIEPGYVCLTSRDAAGHGRIAHTRARHAEPMFKTATCGSEHKLMRLHYPISYVDVVLRLISVGRGVHFHVGLLSADFVEQVHVALEAEGLPREAFVHVGHAADFRAIVAALEVDVYVPTLPQAGGKAMVDAMAAGVPILIHENAIDRLWGGRDLVYPDAPSWTTLAELDDRLARFAEPSYWSEQAAASRSYFDEHHSPSLFARMLRADGRLSGCVPPPLKPYRPNLEHRLHAHALAAQMVSR